MHLLVTGCAGFIGMHTTQRLLKDGHTVTGIDNLNDYYDISLKENRLKQLYTFENFTFNKMDFASDEFLKSNIFTQKYDAIIHLGAQAGVRYSIQNPHAYAKSNLIGHLNLLECARQSNQHNTTPMIYASSSSVYGGNAKTPFSEHDQTDNPVSLYAATKKSDELLSQSYYHLYDMRLTGLRFFTVYGPWGRPDMAPWLFTDAILNNNPIKIFNQGNMARDFTYIDDIVDGIIAALTALLNTPSPSHSIYNLGNNQPEKLLDFVNLIEKHCNKQADKIYLPMQDGDVEITFADINKAQNNLGYQPKTPLNDGLEKFIAWFKHYHQQ